MTRLFHVSDLHFGKADQAALDWFAATVASEKPDAVICTGDLTMRARAREFDAAGRYLEALNVPLTVEPGNHDLPYFNPIDRLFSPYRRYGRVERLVERPLDLKKVMVAPLKTTARFQWRSNWSWGVVSEKALQRTLALLESADKDDLKIVACHHPLLDKEGLESSPRPCAARKRWRRWWKRAPTSSSAATSTIRSTSSMSSPVAPSARSARERCRSGCARTRPRSTN